MDLTISAVNNRFHHLPEVDDPLSNLQAVNDPLRHLPTTDDPLPDPPAVDNPLPHLLVVDDPLSDLPSVNNHLHHLLAVDDPLPDLPYHIIIDILSRLPAECVFQCQHVSRPLDVLTTTPFFTHTHLNQATPVIIVQSFSQSSDRDIKFYFIDKGAKKIEATSMKLEFCSMDKKDPIMLFGSYDGFLLFRNISKWRLVFFIWNPIMKQQVTLTSPRPFLYVCGFYFHPLKREYQVLFLCRSFREFEFHILTLGTKSSSRNVGSFSFPSSVERPPEIINGTLYWMVDVQHYYDVNHVYPSRKHLIVPFKIETEQFNTLQHAGCARLSRISLEKVHLLELEGRLCLCDPATYASSTELNLWVLNPNTKWWFFKYILGLPEDQCFTTLPNPFLWK
ncbi:F-box associated domain [Macleaya cordata]|uniref:F-box associated domain n=1 Tax=Macleaya cordata TaxID=56857 RepID=A0A200R003_MACCD|nr:F-box associated domain [Macleaya cordata]